MCERIGAYRKCIFYFLIAYKIPCILGDISAIMWQLGTQGKELLPTILSLFFEGMKEQTSPPNTNLLFVASSWTKERFRGYVYTRHYVAIVMSYGDVASVGANCDVATTV